MGSSPQPSHSPFSSGCRNSGRDPGWVGLRWLSSEYSLPWLPTQPCCSSLDTSQAVLVTKERCPVVSGQKETVPKEYSDVGEPGQQFCPFWVPTIVWN